MDLIGFGRTPLGPDGAGLEADRVLLAKLLADTGPAILVGSSFGGGVALLQAAADPASVRGLILVGSMLPTPPEGGDARAVLLRRRLRQRLHDAADAARAVGDGRLRPDHASVHAYLLRGNAHDPAAMDDAIVAASVEAAAGRGRGAALRATLEAGLSSFRLMTAGARFESITDAVACPVLLIHGTSDRTVPISYARAAVRGRPAWELVELDGVGHLPHIEAPDVWLGAATAWTLREFGQGPGLKPRPASR